MSDDVSFLSKLVRDSMELQAQEALKDIGDQEVDIMKPLQVHKIWKIILKFIAFSLVRPLLRVWEKETIAFPFLIWAKFLLAGKSVRFSGEQW